jgi:YD repeat-containing protein
MGAGRLTAVKRPSGWVHEIKHDSTGQLASKGDLQ